LFNWNLQSLFYFFNFLSFACFTSVGLFHYLSFAFTVSTSLWTLSIHSRTELNKLFYNSSTFTFCTFLYIFTSFTITLFTISISLDFNVFHTSAINLVKRDFDFNKLWLCLLRTCILLSSSTEKAENITKSTTSSWRSTILNTLLSIFII